MATIAAVTRRKRGEEKKTRTSRFTESIYLLRECPNGYVEEDTFRFIFSHFFPYGNASLYAHYVFRTFDQNKNGAITFKDFIQCLSVLCRGSIQEKLHWAFKLYDLNGDGRITKKELTDIICSVYALMGRKSFTGAEEKALREHVDKTFQVSLLS
ncbi:Kv channel-interacting protein 4 like protein [Argiope bruennichi]|uniref:Kv channel-interacting protein 4 like protein n=1 Tax=Argiope bruennichi TaxID=94029 RepID=A0A8T0FSA1_ARGBR|nr:Kv channel-interacting protein 4 like protein [Argiope bruennichi]